MNALAFCWGFAEATFFFIVPDVVLMFIALRGRATALKASVAALAGALLGGSLMYFWGLESTLASERFLTHIPAIHSAMLSGARTQLDRRGVATVLVAPLGGIPYKIYAVEWGARQGAFWPFLVISIPARYIRFFLSVLVAGALRRFLRPWILAILWIAFYVFYFWKFGW